VDWKIAREAVGRNVAGQTLAQKETGKPGRNEKVTGVSTNTGEQGPSNRRGGQWKMGQVGGEIGKRSENLIKNSFEN